MEPKKYLQILNPLQCILEVPVDALEEGREFTFPMGIHLEAGATVRIVMEKDWRRNVKPMIEG